jgi:hypothetical protein
VVRRVYGRRLARHLLLDVHAGVQASLAVAEVVALTAVEVVASRSADEHVVAGVTVDPAMAVAVEDHPDHIVAGAAM